MTSDGASIVWIDDKEIKSCPVGAVCNGLKSNVTTQSSFPEHPRKLTFFDGRLYITTFPGGADGTSKIYACTIGECTSPQTPIATDSYLPRGVVVTTDAIYWLATAGAYDAKTPVDFRVMRKAR